jgi:hypothetical protein
MKVFEGRMPRRIFEVRGRGRRKWHIEEIHNLYFLTKVIGMIKSRRIKCARHIVRMEDIRNAGRILVAKP